MNFEQFGRVHAVASSYFLQAEPEPQYFDGWIDSLQEPLKTGYRKRGFEGCRETLNFRRFVAELNDERLEEHMQRHLSPEDYRFWQQAWKLLSYLAKKQYFSGNTWLILLSQNQPAMTRKLTNAFGKVFQTIKLDTENNWIEIVSEGYLSQSDVKAGSLALTEVVRESGLNCVLNDMRLVVGPIGASEWAAEVWAPEVAMAGLRCMALLNTPNVIAVAGISKFHAKQTYFQTEIFEDVRKAKAWLQQHCS